LRRLVIGIWGAFLLYFLLELQSLFRLRNFLLLFLLLILVPVLIVAPVFVLLLLSKFLLPLFPPLSLLFRVEVLGPLNH